MFQKDLSCNHIVSNNKNLGLKTLFFVISGLSHVVANIMTTGDLHSR
jgi:hypothetical protein